MAPIQQLGLVYITVSSRFFLLDFILFSSAARSLRANDDVWREQLEAKTRRS